MRKFIEQITRKAGNTALRYFRKSGLKYSHKKNVADVVTEADHASNKVLLEAIKKRFPTHGIISEETGEEYADAEYVWIIDPLDGTRNFFTHTPLWGVMVGLAHKKKLVAAAIYDPNHDEFAYAERGKGAYLNGKRVHCSKTRKFAYSYGTVSSLLRPDKIRFFLTLIRAFKEEVWLGNLGSVASTVILVAAGRRDWWFTSGGAVWDYAPAVLILREAGCQVTNFHGSAREMDDRQVLAANPRLHAKLLKILK